MFMNLGSLAKGRHGVKKTFTPSSRVLTKGRHELIPRHYPQTLTARIVKKLYHRDMKYIRNQLRRDRDACTSDVSEKERYWTIYPVHVRVKLLDQHERTCDWDVTQWLPCLTVNDRGKVDVEKVRQYDLVFQMNASSRKVLRECFVGIIITELKRERGRIKRWRGTGMKKVSGQSGFMLRCHRHVLCKPTERGRKRRQSEKSQAGSNISSILKRSTHV